MLGGACIQTSGARADTAPTDYWQTWDSLTTPEKASIWSRLGSVIRTGEPGEGQLLTDIETAPEGYYVSVGQEVEENLQVSRVSWLEADEGIGAASTGILGATVNVAGAFVVGVAIGNQIDHWFGLPSVGSLFGDKPASVTHLAFVRVTGPVEASPPAYGYDNPSGYRVYWEPGDIGTLELGSHEGDGSYAINIHDPVGVAITGETGAWSWYEDAHGGECRGYSWPAGEECDPDPHFYGTEIAVIPDSVPTLGTPYPSTTNPATSYNDVPLTASPTWPTLAQAPDLWNTIGDNLGPNGRAWFSHVTDPETFPRDPGIDPVEPPALLHWHMPDCLGATVTACEDLITLANGDVGNVVVTVTGDDGAVLTLPPSTVIQTTPGTVTELDVGTNREIDLVVNPGVEDMPYIIPEPAPDDTYETYKQKFPTGAQTRDSPYPPLAGDPTKGPDTVVTTNPPPGGRQNPHDPVIVRTNPPSMPVVVPPGTGSCPAPMSTAIDFSPLTATGLQDKFPFGIFAWMHTMLGHWMGGASAPNFELTVLGHSFNVDMSIGDSAMSIVRPILLIIFTISAVWWLATGLLDLRG
jgi:hypothetical protein